MAEIVQAATELDLIGNAGSPLSLLVNANITGGAT